MRKKIVLIIPLLLLYNFVFGQQGFVAAGRNSGLSENGSVSYSLGQINFTSHSNAEIKINEGIQNAYEIYTLKTEELIFVKFNAFVYPNPTDSDVTLHIDDYASSELSYQLYDMQGKFLFQDKIKESDTKIPLSNYASGTYILRVFSKNEFSKHFKIVKK